MTKRFSFSPGAAVKLRGRSCTILEAVTASSVLVEDAETKETQVVPVSKLSHPDGATKPEPTRALDSLPEDDLAEAKRRFAIIKPLVRCERRSQEDVKRVAEQHGVGLSTLYRWIKTYESRRLVSDLAPRRKGRPMPKRLDAAIEAVIDSVIKDLYLTKQKATGEEVILEVHRRCRAAKLAKPASSTIRKRLRAIDPREKVLKREGRKAAHDKFGRVKGEFPGADSPLAVVQIDHTLLDIIVLDEEMRLPIGRPWLTLAIDVFSRMVVGYHLSLDHPSAFAVGLCLCHGMLDKAAELERLGVKGEWPVWGKPRMIHSDNGKDFRSYCTDSFRRCRQPVEFGEDGFGGLGPDEWLGGLIVRADVAGDGVLQVGHGLEDAAPDAPAGDDREEALDSVDPRGRGGGEMEDPARVIGQPVQHLGVLVGGVVVHDGVDHLARRDGALHGVEERDELLVGVLGHTAPDHGAGQRVQRGEQRGGAVALVVVRHRPALAGLQRQAGLGAVERLDLALLVDRQHHRVARRVHVQPDDVLHLGREGGIAGALEGAQAMGLEAVGLPDALHGAQADADCLGHRPAGPVGDRAGRFRTGQRQHFGHRRSGQRRPAGLARLVAQQPRDALFGVAELPAPYRRAADTGSAGHLQNGQPLGRQ